MSMYNVSIALVVLATGCAHMSAAEHPFGEKTRFFLEDHCFDCHDGATSKGGLNLEDFDFQSADPENLAILTHVHDRALSGEMPPKKKDRPDPAELSAFVKATADPLLKGWTERYTSEGRTVARRLNPTEYEYTLRDLLHAPWLEIKATLPPDPEKYGFDNVAAAQEISYIQMGRFLEAAEIAVDSAMLLRPQVKPKNERVDWQELGRMYGKGELEGKGSRETRVVGDWLVILRQPNESQSPFHISGKRSREPGWYKFRVRCAGVKFHNGELLPPTKGHVATINTTAKRNLATFDVPPGPQGGVVEFVAWQHENDGLEFFCASLDDRLQPSIKKFPWGHPYTGDGIAVDWFEIEGPYATEDCDPTVTTSPSYARLFGDLPVKRWTPKSGLKPPGQLHIPDLTANAHGVSHPFRLPEKNSMVVSENPEADAARLLREFMESAYRRPVEQAEFQRCLAFAIAAIGEKHCFQDAMRPAYQAALCSPDFLYLQEIPGPLDDHAIASRLSYFLWRSLPDEKLRALADTGRLSDRATYLAEIDRMLADPKTSRFINDFTDQWLDLKAVNDTAPDRYLYPEYYGDVHLTESALAETRETFAKMLRENLPASTVIDSDFAIVNERLAKLYGLAPVKGMEMRPVELPAGSPRGGILTQASVLKVSANGLTSSPVTRGVWVLDRLLGNHPPPPPPSAGGIDPDTRGTTTIREQLAKHSTSESCAVCHVHIDPPGFALESFDVMGGWRDHYRAFDQGEPVKKVVAGKEVVYKTASPVDSSGITAEGQAFAGIHEFRNYLLSKEEKVARNLAERLVTFATGAGITFVDRPEISRVLEATENSEHGLRSMVREILLSDVFLRK